MRPLSLVALGADCDGRSLVHHDFQTRSALAAPLHPFRPHFAADHSCFSLSAAAMSSHKKPPHTQHMHKQPHSAKRTGAHNADTPKPNKKQNTAAAAAAGAASAAASSTPARPAAAASMDDDAGLDPAWRTMYAPLPPALQPPTDHTADASRAAASSSASAAAVGAVGGGYIPSLLCGLLPSPSSFESNFNSKVKDKHLVLDNSSAGSKGLGANLGDSLAKAQRKRRKKRGIQMMSSNERKEKGMQHIPKEGVKSETHATSAPVTAQRFRSSALLMQRFLLSVALRRYALFLPLHELWLQYMHDILDPSNSR